MYVSSAQLLRKEANELPYCSWLRLLRHFRDRIPNLLFRNPFCGLHFRAPNLALSLYNFLKNWFCCCCNDLCCCVCMYSAIWCLWLVDMGPSDLSATLRRFPWISKTASATINLIHAKPYQEGKMRWGVGYGVLLRCSCTSCITPGLVNIQYVDIPSDVFVCDLGAVWLDECGLTFVSDGSPESLRQEWMTH